MSFYIFFMIIIFQVTLSRESGSGEYALEAGALVLGDQGKLILYFYLPVILSIWFKVNMFKTTVFRERYCYKMQAWPSYKISSLSHFEGHSSETRSVSF